MSSTQPTNPSSAPSSSGAAPGWYADPWQQAAWRYFDGAAWTSHTAAAAPSAAGQTKSKPLSKGAIIALAALVAAPVAVVLLVFLLLFIATMSGVVEKENSRRSGESVHAAAVTVAETANTLAVGNGEEASNEYLAAALNEARIPTGVTVRATPAVRAGDTQRSGLVVLTDRFHHAACVEIDPVSGRAALSAEGARCRTAASTRNARSYPRR